MSLRRKTRTSLLPLLPLLGLLALGCGNGNSSPDHANTTIDDPSLVDPRAVSQPSDSSVTEIALTASAQYDEGSRSVQVFALAKDQTGTPLFQFNKYNFLVTTDPTGLGRNVDKDSSSYRLEVSDGTAYESDSVVCLVLDVSGSMTGDKLLAAKAAASKFVDGMQAGDMTALVSFSDSASVVQALTTDTALLKQKIDALKVENATNIGAALQTAAGTIGTRPGKRAVILLTDGVDTVDTETVWINNTNSIRWNAVLKAQADGLRVYTIGFGLSLLADATAIADLQTISDQTGGKPFLASNAADLTSVLQTQIPREIDALDPLHTYILSFLNPTTFSTGKTVPYRLKLTFENANGILSANANGTYIVQ